MILSEKRLIVFFLMKSLWQCVFLWVLCVCTDGDVTVEVDTFFYLPVDEQHDCSVRVGGEVLVRTSSDMGMDVDLDVADVADIDVRDFSFGYIFVCVLYWDAHEALRTVYGGDVKRATTKLTGSRHNCWTVAETILYNGSGLVHVESDRARFNETLVSGIVCPRNLEGFRAPRVDIYYARVNDSHVALTCVAVAYFPKNITVSWYCGWVWLRGVIGSEGDSNCTVNITVALSAVDGCRCHVIHDSVGALSVSTRHAKLSIGSDVCVNECTYRILTYVFIEWALALLVLIWLVYSCHLCVRNCARFGFFNDVVAACLRIRERSDVLIERQMEHAYFCGHRYRIAVLSDESAAGEMVSVCEERE
ncbi:b39.5 [miniopterid betaherpesvirus 1]|uniref:B39.5 n=1 Tax=miniopterid betaherpesvirus 1 TaxID=3070189 RepID=I3VQ20_9BETA|nr:b39.5 [miniopterid betaherpesvirus 1]AFK83864.1 b39.5 [miniopterid betaherpesvirus 1]